ncbi:Predicted Zn-dependent protease or its inactivated homolog [Micromonospora echinospora]|uniref:Predicted Zn-dependent protease or its inactivated homolog n=1 Tax=Micromonospora echinospora TaxID=1877 RepID=A0A1C4XG03_MICEC|nr:metallopeptidase TldD-related protein [Micromonospora echinospora]SCF07287.1 Predicted Zn-dependent protease or its inactivated homolog [Micromonospora echinospora]
MSEQEIAGQVVELVGRLAGAGAQAEVTVTRSDAALTRFANSFIHQNVAESTVSIRLRLHADGRTATGSGSLASPDGLRELVERTLVAARLGPPDPGWPGLAPPAPAPAAPTPDEATAHAEPDERAARVRAFVDAAGGLETAGYCRTSHHAAAFANTAGHTAWGRMAEAAMDGIARTGGVDGMARLAADRLGDLDGALLGARAAAKARSGVDPVELPPGRYEVVFEPAAVADLLSNLAMYGFNGKAYAERKSFAEPGAAQFDRTVSLVDDPLAASGLPVDTEGTARRALPLVTAGRTDAVVHDRRTAAATGAASTGHGSLESPTFGPFPHTVRLLPAQGPAPTGTVSGPVVDPDTAALVAGVGRGLLVSDLWYTRVLDPKALTVTGLTRNGVWLIEDGVVTRAVRDLRFTQAYPRALAPGAVLGTGRVALRQPDRTAGAWWSTPPLRLAEWNFTGGASG